MCRGFQQSEKDRLLKVKSFYMLLSGSNKKTRKSVPDSLTLHYLPRISGSPLEINGSFIRPDSHGFVTLYRVVSDESSGGKVMYGSREKVKVGEGVRFEVFLKEEKVVKGSFRKDEGGEWKMECKCGLEGDNDNDMVVDVKDVEVCVTADGDVDGGCMVAMNEKVVMVVKRRKRGRCFEGLLEEIPEQREEVEVDEEEKGACCCCECGGDAVEDGGGAVDVEVEGVRWAVDVGIWVMCLGVGVGYLVSKASSSKSFRRRRLL